MSIDKAYIVTARKYRPQKFNELAGQDHISSTLINAIKEGRVAHSYLFSGPKGTGKTTTARILAKALNCIKGPAPVPCDKCAPCTEIIKGISMDVMEIDGASNRGIEEIRSLRDNVKFAPAGSRFKIYIIDEVHMLTKEAFNALLKTLEEPPAHVKFFFATTEPDRVPSTITSRCQVFRFHRVKNSIIAELLRRIADKEKLNITEQTLYTIARRADGSVRDAETALDKLIAYSGTDIKDEDALEAFGTAGEETLFEISEASADSDAKRALKTIAEISDEGKDIEQFIADLLRHFRDILAVKYSGKEYGLIELPEEDIIRMGKIGMRFSRRELLDIIKILIRAQGELRWALSKRTAAEVCIIDIALIKQRISLDGILNRLEALEKKLDTPAETAHKSGALFKDIKDSWEDILADIGRRNPLLRSYMAEGTLLEADNDCLKIGFDPACILHKESAEKPKNRELIENRLRERFKKDITVKFVIEKEKEAKKTGRHLDNPVVENIRRKFNAKIVSVK